MRQMITIIPLLTLWTSFTSSVNLDPLKDPHICGRPECLIDDATKFRYNTTFQYTYDYRMHVRTEFAGSGQNTSDVFVQATAQLIFPQRCEGILTLKNVQLRNEAEATGSNESDEPAPDYYEFSESESDQTLHPSNVQFGEALQAHELR